MVNTYGDPNVSGVGDIVAADDGGAWFTQFDPSSLASAIDHISPSGTIRRYGVPLPDPYALTEGLDGTLWFASPYSASSVLGSMDPETHEVTVYEEEGLGYSSIVDLAVWPSGDVEIEWYIQADGPTKPSHYSFSRLHVATGTFTGDGSPDHSTRIARGPVHSIWATEAATGRIYRIALRARTITAFDTPPDQVDDPAGLVLGLDGNV